MRRRPLAVAILFVLGAGSVAATAPAASAAACGDQVIVNGGFESGSSPWTASSGVVSAATTAQPAHGGGQIAWLDGYGSAHTDTLSQTVTLPAGCTSASLTYWTHIGTKETSTTQKFDTLVAQIGTTTVASYSNLDQAAGYQQRTVDVTPYLGQTVTIKFTGTEDTSLATDFVLDDFALTTTGGGGGDQSPTVTNPGAQSSTAGQPASLQIHATDPQGDTLTYGATGLPAGLSINSTTGLVSGTPSTAGSSNVTVTASDPGGHSGSATFGW